VFSAEYIIRIWIAPEHVPYRQLNGRAARRIYILSAQGIVDCLAIVPLWGALLEAADLRVLIVLRVLRVMKFSRYSPGMSSLLAWDHTRRHVDTIVTALEKALYRSPKPRLPNRRPEICGMFPHLR
jgi:hypothetical protein